MSIRIGVSGLWFSLFLLSGCHTTSGDDAGPDLRVVVETRYLAGGPHGDGGFLQSDIASYSSIKLFVGGDAGVVRTGRFDDGRIVFEDVPTTDNVLELRYPHPQLAGGTLVVRQETHRRAIYLGYYQWARSDVALAEAGTNLRIDATGLVPWSETDDTLYAYSAQAQFARGWWPDPDLTTAPAQDATTVTGTEVNTADMGAEDYRTTPAIVDASRGDTLTLLQHRQPWFTGPDGGLLDAWDPWAATYPLLTIAHAQVSMPQFSAAEPVQLTASFTELTPSPFTLAINADSFAASAADLEMPATARMASNNTIYFEAGDGETLYLAPSPVIWNHSSRSSQRIPENPECYPNQLGACDAGCNACDSPLTTDYRAPGNFVLPAYFTHPITDPGTEMLATDWRISTIVTVPDAGALSLTAWNYNSRPVPLATSVVVERVLSPPRAVRVHGASVPPSTPNVTTLNSATPTLSWSAPSQGTPDFYRVQVVEYVVRSPGNVALYSQLNLMTSSTTATIPEGVLLPGHLYVLRVVATIDPNDPDDVRLVRRAASYHRAEAITGVVTAP